MGYIARKLSTWVRRNIVDMGAKEHMHILDRADTRGGSKRKPLSLENITGGASGSGHTDAASNTPGEPAEPPNPKDEAMSRPKRKTQRRFGPRRKVMIFGNEARITDAYEHEGQSYTERWCLVCVRHKGSCVASRSIIMDRADFGPDGTKYFLDAGHPIGKSPIIRSGVRHRRT